MSRIKLQDLLREDAETKIIRERMNNIYKYFKGRKLDGRHELKNLRFDFNDTAIRFELEIPGAPVLEFWISDVSFWKGTTLMPAVEIEVSSPSKRGTYRKKVTGKNVRPQVVWKTIENIWNYQYK